MSITYVFVESTAMAFGFSLAPETSNCGVPANPSVVSIPIVPLTWSVKYSRLPDESTARDDTLLPVSYTAYTLESTV